MSWSFSFDLNENEPSIPEDLENSSLEAINQACFATSLASAIASSGLVGDHNKNYRISLSGHANKNHEPKEGWANDYIQITVSQK